MVSVLVEDAIGKPCVGCGIPAQQAAIWQPTEECLRTDFGLPDGQPATAVFPLCPRCDKKSHRSRTFKARIDAVVIKILREKMRNGDS
jgi:hypothetical protein